MEGRRSFKYSARVEADEVNTSHGIVVDMVGSAKRVLDVGCATGYLAEALAAQGNTVSGVEIDRGAAEEARPHLDRLVVGDVEALDLVQELGREEFDVVIFADVLEHLKDPVSVLRRSRPLLADGGFAVLSIPNVAHGSVRLALMHGRFDYRPLGLLDETHLRFFTREHLEEMLSDAGFVAVEWRQTTAGPFETEIPLTRSDFPPEVIAEVEADPDSRVYQFLVRAAPAAPTEGRAGAGEGSAAELGEALASILALAGGGNRPPVVGVLDPGTHPAAERLLDAPLGALRMAVTVLELRRRLAGFEVRALSLSPQPMVSELGDDLVESLAPWGRSSVADLRAEVDALVVLPGPLSLDAREILAEIEEGGLPVQRLGAGGDGPDPLALVLRLADRSLLEQRRQYLAVTGRAPAADPYVLSLAFEGAGVEEAAGSGRPVVRPDGPLLPIDILAVIDAADATITSSASVAALARGLGRPVVATTGELAGLLGRRDAARAATGEVDGDAGDHPGGPDAADQRAGPDAGVVSQVDQAFDELHDALLVSASRRLAPTVSQRLASLQRRVATLEAVNAGLRQALGRERFVMAAEVRRRESGYARQTGAWSTFNIDRMSRDLATAHDDLLRLQGEIDRIYATRAMRTIAPVRRIYSRLRRLIPRP